jgi:hypothetical protein
MYTINYERMLNDNLSFRIGYTSWEFSLFGSGFFTGVPFICNYLSGSGDNKLELGIGLEFVKASIKNFFGLVDEASASFVLGTCLLYYRYQPRDGGFHFRVGLNPLLVSVKGQSKIIFGVGASVGYCF